MSKAPKKKPQQNKPEPANKSQNPPVDNINQNQGQDQSPTRSQVQPQAQVYSPQEEQAEFQPQQGEGQRSPQQMQQGDRNLTNPSPPQEEENDEVPTDKDKLVEYLKNKLTKSEMTLSTLFVAIQIERDKREKLVREIEERKEELEEVNQQENNFLGEKVQVKMTTALKRALEDKVLADQEIEEAAGKLEEVERAIQEIDENIQIIHKEKCKKEYDADEAQYRVNEQESIIDSFNEDIDKLMNANLEKDRTISDLNDEINDMKSVVEMLITARNKLNYYIPDETPLQSRENIRNMATPTNEGGFSEMVGARGYGQRYISDDMERGLSKTVKQNHPQGDDDFWYADPTARSNKAVPEVKRGGYNEPLPWQPKVQNTENMTEREKLYARTQEYNANTSVKLPSIVNPNAKSEYLYKNKEFIDEFGAANPKNLKKTQSQKKKQY